VLEFREQGYLPEALLNFMALVGWSLDDKTDIISREELIKKFLAGTGEQKMLAYLTMKNCNG